MTLISASLAWISWASFRSAALAGANSAEANARIEAGRAREASQTRLNEITRTLSEARDKLSKFEKIADDSADVTAKADDDQGAGQAPPPRRRELFDTALTKWRHLKIVQLAIKTRLSEARTAVQQQLKTLVEAAGFELIEPRPGEKLVESCHQVVGKRVRVGNYTQRGTIAEALTWGAIDHGSVIHKAEVKIYD
jgi:hypothetical protein